MKADTPEETKVEVEKLKDSMKIMNDFLER